VITRLRGQFPCLALDFPGCGLSAVTTDGDHSVQANALVLRRFVEALDLRDITMVVHDIGGPVGLLVATQQPQQFRALVITNTFAWPLAGYPAVRRVLRIVASPQFGALNRLTNLLALFTATSYGVGRRVSPADRRSFLGPWRSRHNRVATRRILAGALGIDPLLAEIESSLETELSGLPVLTLFGRKNDRYGWQDRFHHIFPGATAVTIDDGHHFPFDDDPQAYTDAIYAWWTAKVSIH
jgi:pimeloyl-ACP methyl ester carboxylesterase